MRSSLVLPLLALSLWLGPLVGRAGAAACHSVGSASWNGIADAAPWDCATTGPGDSFEVESGHTITITAPIQWIGPPSAKACASTPGSAPTPESGGAT